MADLSHIVTKHVGVPPQFAFDFLKDPVTLGRWSLGCFQTEATENPEIFMGHSLYDGSKGWYSIKPDDALRSIDYLVGAENNLVHRISARVIAGPQLDYPEDSCLVTLMAWRSAGMNEERWARLCTAHEAESFLISSQIEAEFARI